MKRAGMLALMLYPLLAFTHSFGEHTITKHYQNESTNKMLVRNTEYPTQIVRVKGSISELQLSCDQVAEEISSIFINKITVKHFWYNTYTYCSYDPQTKLATSFGINSYFDPLDDNAIDYLTNYLAENNGREFLGTHFQVENAKGLIVSLKVISGIKVLKKKRNRTIIKLHREDSNVFYYPNNFTLNHDFISDIYQRFYTNDPTLILPFLKKWLFNGAESIYNYVLREVDYIELQPEKIFLMQSEGDIFVSNFKMSYAHTCTAYPNKHCL